MQILNFVPLASAVFGILLGFFILLKKSGLGKNRRLRLVLALLVFLLSFTAIDYYLFLNDYYDFTGFSALYDHLIGFLFYYFIALFTGTQIPIKKWAVILILYTAIRYSFILPYLDFDSADQIMTNAVNTAPVLNFIMIEYLMVGLVNLILVIAGYLLFRNRPQYTLLDKRQQLHLQWIRIVIIAIIILTFSILLSSIITFFDFERLMSYLRFETLLYVIFFLVLAFSMMQFPVFVFTGDYDDIDEGDSSLKYKKSSLSNSSELFARIEKIVVDEQLYLNQELKLNSLADRLDQSLHHVSQAINENTGKSFPDYINRFRIEEAKKKLLEPRPDTIFAIAIDVGFNSKANFYYSFKKLTGSTPTAFRTKHYNPDKD